MNGRVTSGFCLVTYASDCAVAQVRRRAVVPAHNGGGGPRRARTVTGRCRQEVCGQLPRDSSIVRLGRGSGHRNCSYRVSLSMKRFSHEMLYFAIVVFDEFGVKWVALLSSRYARSSDEGRLL